MKWLELSVVTDHEAVESVSELFACYGYNGGVVIEPVWIATAESDGWVGYPKQGDAPPPQYQTDLSQPVTLRTYIAIGDETEQIRQQLEQALWHFGQLRPVGPLQTRVLEEEDWANAWKQHYSVLHIGKRVVIVPSWLEYQSQPEEIVLHLDPGMAFGTGLHPTTQFCIRLLEAYLQTGFSILDVGTGSGILGIAAAKLGAGRVLAIDNDPVAVEVARKNVQHNQVHPLVAVALGSLGVESFTGESNIRITAGFQLIVANIIANVLIALAQELATALVSNGILISSGIIKDREDEVALAFASVGLSQIERCCEGDWVAFVHKKL